LRNLRLADPDVVVLPKSAISIQQEAVQYLDSLNPPFQLPSITSTYFDVSELTAVLVDILILWATTHYRSYTVRRLYLAASILKEYTRKNPSYKATLSAQLIKILDMQPLQLQIHGTVKTLLFSLLSELIHSRVFLFSTFMRKCTSLGLLSNRTTKKDTSWYRNYMNALSQLDTRSIGPALQSQVALALSRDGFDAGPTLEAIDHLMADMHNDSNDDEIRLQIERLNKSGRAKLARRFALESMTGSASDLVQPVVKKVFGLCLLLDEYVTLHEVAHSKL